MRSSEGPKGQNETHIGQRAGLRSGRLIFDILGLDALMSPEPYRPASALVSEGIIRGGATVLQVDR